MNMFYYESEDFANICKEEHSSDTLYEAECKQTIIEGVKGSYPQLIDYEKEWLMYGREHYEGGEPSNLEYQTVEVNPTAMVENAIPYNYKSAILKGKTLINIISDEIFMDAGSSSITNITELRKNYLIPMVKTNTNYLVSYELTGDEIEGADASNLVTALGFLNHNSAWSSNMENQPLKGKLIINSGENPNYFRIVLSYRGYSKLNSVKINVIEYQNGMENCDISYFEGMKSVQMPDLTTTGKNMFDGQLESGGFDYNTGAKSDNTTIVRTIKPINASGLTHVVTSRNTSNTHSAVFCYDDNMNFLGRATEVGKTDHRLYTLLVNTKYINVLFQLLDDTIDVLKASIQIESGQLKTSYEPFKSNILTVNEEVELRGVGDVRDELDLLTGELTQRVGEVVMDGSEDWSKQMNNTNLPYRFVCNNALNYSNYKEICDSFSTGQSYWNVDATGFYIGTNHKPVISFKSGDKRANYSIEQFKQYLSENPITIQYQLATESIETVELSTLTKPYEGTNHYTVSSDTIPPVAVLSVPIVSTGEQTLNDILTSE